MSRRSLLNELSAELCLLYDQDVTEKDAYNLLRTDQRFPSLRLAKVTTIYKKFRNEQRRKKTGNPFTLALIKRSHLLSYYNSTMECDHSKYRCLKLSNGQTAGGRFFARWRLDLELNLVYCSLTDLFSNKERETSTHFTPIRNVSYFIYPLTTDFGLLFGCENVVGEQAELRLCLKLLQIECHSGLIREIQNLAFKDQEFQFKGVRIIVDSIDPFRFIMDIELIDETILLKYGRLENGGIVFTNEVAVNDYPYYYEACSLIGNMLYCFNFQTFSTADYIYAFDLEQDSVSEFALEPLPKDYSAISSFVGCMALDRVFLAAQFKKTNNFGIFWASRETLKWTRMDFGTKHPITNVRFVEDEGFLLIQAVSQETELISGVHQLKKICYRIPLKKPDLLRNLAWFSLLRSKSKLDGVDPYEEAKNYLPYCSEIQCPFDEFDE